MRRFGLIGYPLGHSFSKKYFTEKFLQLGLDNCTYENFEIDSIRRLYTIINSVDGLEGLNVTIPYKTAVIDYLTEISAEASEIGAVNVIRITDKNGKKHLKGFNSDVFGILHSLEPYSDRNLRRAMVLGTGGSSRAVNYALNKLGLEIVNVSRNPAVGQLSYVELNSELFRKTDLLVNTTPLGMFPEVTGKPALQYDWLESRHILFDLVYNPEYTAFLNEGKKRGCTIITGVKMLISQAEKSWDIWNDHSS
jgi:shikimate dehydrogenase